MGKLCTTCSRIAAFGPKNLLNGFADTDPYGDRFGAFQTVAEVKENAIVFRYYAESDMLYIELAAGVSTESEEVASNIVLDYDQNNQVIGIEIEDASRHIDLSNLEISALPFVNLVVDRATAA